MDSACFLLPLEPLAVLSPPLTSRQVHKAMQGIDLDCPDKNHAIIVHAIAEQLDLSDDDLMVHINTLLNLYYIEFADLKHSTVMLTFNGRFTRVPQWE